MTLTQRGRHSSALVGFVLTVVWSAEFVDQSIGENVAGTVLGPESDGELIAKMSAGVLFALASRITGTFTACCPHRLG